jgi:hypothetical protein
VAQTGQRLGAAIGIASVGSVFFARLAAVPGHWAQAFRTALLVAMALVGVALATALADVLVGRHTVGPGR